MWIHLHMVEKKYRQTPNHKLKCICGKCHTCWMREYKRRNPSRRISRKVSDKELVEKLNEYWEKVKTDEYQGRQCISNIARVEDQMIAVYGKGL